MAGDDQGHRFPFDYRPLSVEATGEEGWHSWNLIPEHEGRYNHAFLGELMVRQEGTSVRLRMKPERRHTNIADNIHGGTILGLLDIALFATQHLCGSGSAGAAVTLEMSTQFVGAGDPSRPLDAVSEVVRETGKLAFVRGMAMQGDHVVASYSGILRKFSRTT